MLDPSSESAADIEAMRDIAQGANEGRAMEERTVLWIGGFYSQCGACGRNADPYEKSHDNATMQGEGCGATYTHTASKDLGIDAIALHNMRPDLPVRS